MAAAIVKHWFLENHENPHIEDGSIRVLEDISDTLDFIGYNYGDPIPDLSEYDKVIMCDISFPLTNMLEINDRLMDSETLETNFIWIDHHISAIKSNITVETEGLRNTNFAACELTWKHLMQGMRGDPNKESTNNSMPEIVRLLGLYDSFNHTRKNNFTREEINDCLDNKFYHHKDSRENAIDDWFHGIDVKLKKALPRANDEQKVLEFQYGARGVIGNYEEAYDWLIQSKKDLERNNKVFDVTPEDLILNQGKAIYSYLCTEAKQTYKNGFEIELIESKGYIDTKGSIATTDHRKFIAINRERFNPINFGIDYHKDGYDGCACFWFADGNWNFSLYNDNGEVDCSTIAKQYGGGGHFSAAGFRINDLKEII